MTARLRTGGRKHFTRAQIANMIELHIGYGHSKNSIARAFRISDRTVRYYINKHYYGFSKSQYQVISKESIINDREDLLMVAV